MSLEESCTTNLSWRWSPFVSKKHRGSILLSWLSANLAYHETVAIDRKVLLGFDRTNRLRHSLAFCLDTFQSLVWESRKKFGKSKRHVSKVHRNVQVFEREEQPGIWTLELDSTRVIRMYFTANLKPQSFITNNEGAGKVRSTSTNTAERATLSATQKVGHHPIAVLQYTEPKSEARYWPTGAVGGIRDRRCT